MIPARKIFIVVVPGMVRVVIGRMGHIAPPLPACRQSICRPEPITVRAGRNRAVRILSPMRPNGKALPHRRTAVTPRGRRRPQPQPCRSGTSGACGTPGTTTLAIRGMKIHYSQSPSRSIIEYDVPRTAFFCGVSGHGWLERVKSSLSPFTRLSLCIHTRRIVHVDVS